MKMRTYKIRPSVQRVLRAKYGHGLADKIRDRLHGPGPIAIPERETARMSIRATDEDEARLKELAEKHGVSVGQILRAIAEELLDP